MAFDPLTDDRFRSKLLSSSDFALDPTAPQFRNSMTAPKLAKAVAEQRRAIKKKQGSTSGDANGTSEALDDLAPVGTGKSTEKAKMAAMVKSLKRKVGEQAAKKKKQRL